VADPFARYDTWLEAPYEAEEVCHQCGRDMSDHDEECGPSDPIDYTHEDEMRRDEAADRKYEEQRERRYE